MAALNRLSQRIKENFHETTRDFSLLTGGSGSSQAAYFDTSDDKIKEISKLLESRSEKDRLEGMKRIIAGISKGRDMEAFFAQVVKNVVAPSIEIRKLVYIYLLRFATTNSDLLLLSINTFQKDLSDPSPLIRSMSLRVLTSIRVPVIQGIVMLGLKKLVNDRNPWVRKTVAGGLAKVYEMDPSSLSQLIPLLQTLLSSPSPLTLGATLTAFEEICPNDLALLHPYYRHICRILVDADEWGQAVALEVLTRYARTMLEKPDLAGPIRPPHNPPSKDEKTKHAAGEESEDEFQGLDEDLAMLLHYSKTLFQSRNPAVVLATAKMYYHLAPAGNIAVGQELLVAPLLRLAGSSDKALVAGEEVSAIVWQVIESMVEERPWLFEKYQRRFFVHGEDSATVATAKIRSMSALLTEENAAASIREFKHYVRFPNETIAEEAVRAIGQCIKTQASIATTGLAILMKLLKSNRGGLVATSVLVLKSVIMSQGKALSDPQKLVAKLAKSLDDITHPSARASVFWLVGQFAAEGESSGNRNKMIGLGWDGVVDWVPDVLRKGVKGFTNEGVSAKLQVLTLAAKILVLCPGNSTLTLLSTYLSSLARYDPEYDIRDRSRFLSALIRGLKLEKSMNGDASASNPENQDNGGTQEEEEDEEMGGATLRREQLKVVLLGERFISEEKLVVSEYQVGSMSRTVGKRLAGYEGVPEWTDDPTDSSLRDSELENHQQRMGIQGISSASAQAYSSATSPAVAAAVYQPQATGSVAAASIPRGISPSVVSDSPAGSAPLHGKTKFKDLDAFLNSESEDETEEEESDDESPPRRPQAVTAPPRSAIVPEYDEDTSEEDSAEEEDSDNDSDNQAESKPLYNSGFNR